MKAIYLLIFSLLLINIGCNKDNNDKPENCNTQGNMYVKFMGEEYNLSSFSNTFVHISIGNEPARLLQLNTIVADGQIAISASGLEEHNHTPGAIKEKVYTVHDSQHTECYSKNSTTYCDGAQISFTSSSMQFFTDDEYESSVTITHIDAQKKLVSGSFKGIMSNFQNFNPTDTLHIEGTFENLCYNVVD